MKKRVLAVIFAGVIACAALAGCGSTSTTSSTAAASSAAEASSVQEATSSTETTDAAATVEDAGGFTENPIWSDAELGADDDHMLIHMNGVWFQSVPMSGGYENDPETKNIHIEADIAALENTLGFGVGDWIPYLNVAYSIADSSSGNVVAEGNFMPMSASDGPHYGANIKLDAGTYDFTVNVSPDEDTYLIHLDSETGPGGNWDEYFPNGQALSYTYKGWEFAGYEQ